MSRDPKKSQIEFSESEIKEIGFRAYLNSSAKTAFNAGFSLAEYLHATSMARVDQILASSNQTPDQPTPQQDTPSMDFRSSATPAPAVEEEAPSDEDPFAEFINNQNQTTAHHA